MVMGARAVRKGQSSVAVHESLIVATDSKKTCPSEFILFFRTSLDAHGRMRMLEASIVLKSSYLPDHLTLVA